MRLTLFSDYSLRVLIYLGAHPDRRCSVREIARSYAVSEHHLVKVVHSLGRMGFVLTARGRGGGIMLARPPESLRIGEVVRRTEGCDAMADCATCVIAPVCGLATGLHHALSAFFRALDAYTLADLLAPADALRKALHPPEELAALVD